MRSAFTLIETVIALGLGVLLLLGVQRIVIHSYKTALFLELTESAEAELANPIELLTTDLNSRPAGSGFALRDRVLTFQTLNAMQSDRLAARHAVVVRYALKDDHESVAVTRSEWETNQTSHDATEVMIGSDLDDAAIEIFDGQRWHDRWPPQTPRSAKAVRIRIEVNGSTKSKVIRLAPFRWRRHDG